MKKITLIEKEKIKVMSNFYFIKKSIINITFEQKKSMYSI